MAEAVLAQLTAREREVLAAVGRRLTNAEIAAELAVSVRTVESHTAALRRKTGASTRTALVRAAEALPLQALPPGTSPADVRRAGLAQRAPAGR